MLPAVAPARRWMPATPTPLRPPEWANRCGCAGSRGSCSHDPAAPTPDNGLGGCGECEPHSDATPTPNAAPDVVMSDACSSSVEMSPEAALQGLARAHAVSARRGHLQCHRRAAQSRSRAHCSDGVHGPRRQQGASKRVGVFVVGVRARTTVCCLNWERSCGRPHCPEAG